jgi:hypothetical protein
MLNNLPVSLAFVCLLDLCFSVVLQSGHELIRVGTSRWQRIAGLHAAQARQLTGCNITDCVPLMREYCVSQNFWCL